MVKQVWDRDGTMQRVGSSYGIVVLCVFSCGMIGSCDRSGKQLGAATIAEVDAALKIRELPILPPTATSVQFWKGGAFAKYLNVKFSAGPEEALDYFRRAKAEGYFEFREDAGKYFVTATHGLTDAPMTAEKPSLFELERNVGIRAEPWFRSVYDIRHGWYWTVPRVLGGCQFYYDVDTRQFYIYWWYS